jgi:hypothetical protein
MSRLALRRATPHSAKQHTPRSDPGHLLAMMTRLEALWKLHPPGEPEAIAARVPRRDPRVGIPPTEQRTW